MKIAIIANPHFPVVKPFSGGLVAHTYQLTELLVQKGHDVTLFAPEGSDLGLPFKPFCSPSLAAGEKPTLERSWACEVFYQRLMTTIESAGFDLVHNNSYACTPLRLVKSSKIPMVTVLHCPPSLPMLNGFKEAVTAANHFTIAVSKTIAKRWDSELKGICPEIIHNSISTTFWEPKDNLFKEDYAIWVGRITKEKGTHLAIEAAVKADTELRICGPIHDSAYYQQKVVPLLRKHSGQVSYLGSKSSEQLAPLLQRASVFVCTPCWTEAFGIVLAEALASGTPVAGFSRGALPEILDSRTAVLVDADTSSLATAIKQAKALKSADCRKYAAANFSDERMINHYLRIYEEAVFTVSGELRGEFRTAV